MSRGDFVRFPQIPPWPQAHSAVAVYGDENKHSTMQPSATAFVGRSDAGGSLLNGAAPWPSLEPLPIPWYTVAATVLT